MKQYSLTTLWRALQITLLSLLALMGILALTPVFHREMGFSAGGSSDVLGVEAQVDHLSLSLLDYLENHQPEVLTQIAKEGKEITGLLNGYKDDLRADQLAAYAQLDEASRTLREATLQIIAADNAQLEDKARLDDLQKELKDTLDEMPQGSRRITRQLGTAALLVVDIDAQQTKIEQDAFQKTAWFQKFSKAHEELNEFLQTSEPNAETPKKLHLRVFQTYRPGQWNLDFWLVRRGGPGGLGVAAAPPYVPTAPGSCDCRRRRGRRGSLTNSGYLGAG